MHFLFLYFTIIKCYVILDGILYNLDRDYFITF